MLQARKQLESSTSPSTTRATRSCRTSTSIANYNTVGIAGTAVRVRPRDFPPPVLNQSQRSFSDALRDVFGNDFKTWSVQLQLNYPIGTSQADAGLASGRLQREQELTRCASWRSLVTAAVRDAGAPGEHQPAAGRGHAQGAGLRRAAASKPRRSG